MKKLLSKINPFRITFNFIRGFKCVRDYQHSVTYETMDWSSRSHIDWSIYFSLIGSAVGFIHPHFLWLYVLLFHLHSPWCEDIFQYHKEQVKMVPNVAAQKWERGAGFLLMAWLPITVLVVTLVFKCSLLQWLL